MLYILLYIGFFFFFFIGYNFCLKAGFFFFFSRIPCMTQSGLIALANLTDH
jgi:hypothetical protein